MFAVGQTGHLLRRAYAIGRRNSAEALAVLGDLSPVQASVIGALRQGALSQAELGRRIGMEPANTHSIVRRMDTAGLIEKDRDPVNRRVSLVALSDHGAMVGAQIEKCNEAATKKTLAALDNDERTMLVSMLSRIVLADGSMDY